MKKWFDHTQSMNNLTEIYHYFLMKVFRGKKMFPHQNSDDPKAFPKA